MSKVKVPDGMFQAALKYQDSAIQCSAALEAALRWLSENPIVPTDEQILKLQQMFRAIPEPGNKQNLMITAFQRLMFLESEPEVPEMVKDLIWDKTPGAWPSPVGEHTRIHNEQLIEAYRRGQQSKR